MENKSCVVNDGQIIGSPDKYGLVSGWRADGDMLLAQVNLGPTLSPFANFF